MSAKTDAQPQVPINTGDDMSRGRYSNAMLVTHGAEEFIIDWFLQSPNGPHLVSRIIVAPGHMKRIASAFQENIERYEESFGKIKVAEPPPNPLVQ
ncbi:MAG: DUF3467 domain-containing protein [Syntrophorhabdaceae bacterium]|nr:DUF3467 domain-containing protein [Syntrophorhabdaceae bacterium]